ncbi:outer membrane beta-barrel protein [Photobacterium sagamiensis]|uniref:outer membrane beta-barrel protein n=1 Tax=Photobacterium sagamiensis TaxID=2910241 RepID=UPI003D12943B
MSIKYHVLYLILFSQTTMAAVIPNPYVTDSGIEVTPFFAVSFGHNDNITSEKESRNKISSMLLEMEPSVMAMAEHGDSIYSTSYTLTNGSYFDSSADNYLDHNLDLASIWHINLRNSLMLNYELSSLHEPRGSGISEGISSSTENFDEPIQYVTNHLNATYIYGAEGAKGRLEGSIGWYDESYKNFRNTTQFNDYNESRYDAAFYYQLTSTTDLLLNIKKEDRRYDKIAPEQASQDNDTMYYYIGAEWDITGKTTGTARLGLQDKQFKDSSREDFDGASWDIGITWSPKRYSILNLDTSQTARDPDQDGDYIEETIYTLGWHHFWRERFTTNVSYSNADENYTGVSRKDKTDIWSVSASYDMRRWLSITLGWDFTDKTSSQANIGHEQQIWYLTALFTL